MAYWEHAILSSPQIPYEPTQFDNFRAWTNPRVGDGAHPFQRSCKSITFVEGGASSSHVFIDAFLRHNLYPLQIGLKEGSPPRSSDRMSEGFSLSLIIDLGSPSLFQEKAAMPNSSTWDILRVSPERKRICREPFTLDKWNNMTTYKVDQQEQPQPAARRASPRHIPEGIIAAPAIPELH
ncbi:hypothetical protein AAG906_017385 [Vitis piasezkii]